jgi:hypothetical protein
MAFVAVTRTIQPDVGFFDFVDAADFSETDPPPPPGSIYGVGLAALTEGIVVAYRVEGDEAIYTQKSTSLAVAAWHDAETVTEAADDHCAPSLAAAPNDDLWIAWHDGAAGIFIQRHVNGWQAAVTTSPTLTGKHPRLLLTKERQYIAYWDTGATEVRLYGSTDFFETLTLLETFALSEQAVSLFVDRAGLLHLLGEDGGDTVQWTSADGLTWTDRGVLEAGVGVPMAGYTVAGGALFAWAAADQLQAWRLDGPHLDTAAGPADITDLFPEQVAGVCVDRYDVVWLALQTSGGFAIEDVGRFAPDGQFAFDQEEIGMP